MSDAQEIERLTDLVHQLEWGSCDGCGGSGFCPLCREADHKGHAEDCPVRLTLQEQPT